mmetsp:Transcript_5943/g.17010  ORF Transcript_5943/g.17010 Transcript_5943/m.17010 type:complete len:221 (+) Transcript_5943:212-874(+)
MLLQCLGRKPPLQLHSLAAWSALYTRGFATNHIGTSSASPSKLDEIMKVDALIDKTPEEVQDIWTNYHDVLEKTDQRAGTVLHRSNWTNFEPTANSAPNFVLPVTKGPGKSLNMLLQCQLPFVLFTQLEDYKQMKEYAPPAMIVTHYTELIKSHDLILARADILQPHMLTKPEASSLLRTFHLMYSDPGRFIHVHRFNHDPDNFRWEEMVAELGAERLKD